MGVKTIKRFLKRAFIPYTNPSLNIDAIVTISGLLVWGICAVGEAFGYATMPIYVSDIGPLLFGIGIGRASKETKIGEKPDV